MVKPLVDNEKFIDFSFMPSLQCDLSCGHCMYNSSPTNKAELDFEQASWFASTIDWDVVNACGFYGGEPGINLEMYERFIGLIPEDMPRFTITDGTWSRTSGRTGNFIDWALRNRLQVFISSTPYHTPHQNTDRLIETCEAHPSFVIKPDDDTIIPMGRMSTEVWECGFRCQSFIGPVRFALMPSGRIVFQSCDGVYPVIQTYQKPFANLLDTYESIVGKCQAMKIAQIEKERGNG